MKLVVALGNPGDAYARTRHNVGWLVADHLARHLSARFTSEKFGAELAEARAGDERIWIMKPQTFMNHSGESVGPALKFWKLELGDLVVVHDDMELEPYRVQLKVGGGHGGHNGLRDIIAALGNSRGFHRLRIGIGHPGAREKVSPHVLSRPSPADRRLIDLCIEEALHVLPDAVSGNWPIAMNRLNSFRAE